jgi:branched-chain amino acid transport system substrate-binding protein
MYTSIKIAAAFSLFIGLKGFDTITQAEDYLRVAPFPIYKIEHILRPNYRSFYLQKKPSLIARSLESMKLRKLLWSPAVLSYFLRNLVVREREHKGFTGEYILIQTPKPGTRYIIFGPLLGALPSLVRDLRFLQSQGLINEELKVTQPDCFIIFTGNVINGGPYVLETLTLVLSLMYKNPATVLYLKGRYEDQLYWENTLLKQQLKIQADYVSHEFIPLHRILTRLFNTLPLGIYLNSTNPQDGLLQISYFPVVNDRFSALSCEQALRTIHPTMYRCRLSTTKKSQKNFLPIRASIKAEDRLTSYKNHPGLVLLAPEQGATIWSVFSSPNKMYQEQFSFFYDAFVILTIGSTLLDSTISLYNQDLRDPFSFNKASEYNIVTGQPVLRLASAEPPFASLFSPEKQKPTPEKIIKPQPITGIIQLGSSMDLSKSVQFISKNTKDGISAAVNHINQQGGINHKLYQVIIFDDEYNPSLARINIESLMKDNIRIILCPVGTPTLLGVLDLIKSKQIFVLFPNSGSPLFRSPDLTNIINFRPTYASEAKALTYHMVKELKSRKFAFFYQDDTYGRPPLEAARQMLKKMGHNDWIEASYTANTIEVTAAVKLIKQASPDTIGLFSVTPATIELLRELGDGFLIDKKLFAISPLSEALFKEYCKSSGLKVTFAQVVPNPATSTLEIVKEYRDEIAKQALSPEVYALEGYIYASIAADYLSRIRGPITFEALKKLIVATKNYHFKGLVLTFNKETNELAHYLWIEQPDGKWIEQDLSIFKDSNALSSTTEDKK